MKIYQVGTWSTISKPPQEFIYLQRISSQKKSTLTPICSWTLSRDTAIFYCLLGCQIKQLILYIINLNINEFSSTIAKYNLILLVEKSFVLCHVYQLTLGVRIYFFCTIIVRVYRHSTRIINITFRECRYK